MAKNKLLLTKNLIIANIATIATSTSVIIKNTLAVFQACMPSVGLEKNTKLVCAWVVEARVVLLTLVCLRRLKNVE